MTLPANNNADRLSAVRRAMTLQDLDYFLVTNPVNIRYLLKRPLLFDSHFSGALLISNTQATLFVDARYAELASGAEIDAGIEFIREPLIETLTALAEKEKMRTLGVESRHLRAAAYIKLSEKLGEVVKANSALVEEVRAVKDSGEIMALTAAARLGDKIFPRLLERVRPGVTERELALEIEVMFRRDGASGVSFEPIVASGPNSAIPHAGATDRKLRPGDLLKLDFGCVLNGYCSDMTRTVVLGKPSARQKEIYELVRTAQQAALDSLRPGMTGMEADAAAREVFAAAARAELFIHNLGHGVGLEVHERPTLGTKSQQKLRSGMVFTIEPGLYESGFGGVRIEDMVVMGENGPEILTKAPKEIIVL